MSAWEPGERGAINEGQRQAAFMIIMDYSGGEGLPASWPWVSLEWRGIERSPEDEGEKRKREGERERERQNEYECVSVRDRERDGERKRERRKDNERQRLSMLEIETCGFSGQSPPLQTPRGPIRGLAFKTPLELPCRPPPPFVYRGTSISHCSSSRRLAAVDRGDENTKTGHKNVICGEFKASLTDSFLIVLDAAWWNHLL